MLIVDGFFLLLSWICFVEGFQSFNRKLRVTFDLSVARNQEVKIGSDVLSYDYYEAKNQDSPVFYLPGLFRQKNEAKSSSLLQWCKRGDVSFISSDYFGVGRSSGLFSDGSVSRWTDDTIYLIENVLGPKASNVLLVGHGVGTWISFLVALRRPDLIGGIVGLSADPDFTEELLWKRLPDDVKEKIMTEGVCDVTWGQDIYPISKNLIEDGRKNLLLNRKEQLAIKCPVRLVHAIDDEEVPYELAFQLINNLETTDASLVLLKGCAHSLESDLAINTMRSMVTELLSKSYKGRFDLRSPSSG